MLTFSALIDISTVATSAVTDTMPTVLTFTFSALQFVQLVMEKLNWPVVGLLSTAIKFVIPFNTSIVLVPMYFDLFFIMVNVLEVAVAI